MTLTPNPMGPCTGPLDCRLAHDGPGSFAATWCVVIGHVDPIPACDYHADLLARALGSFGIGVMTTPIEVPERVLDLPEARALVAEPDAEPEYPEVDMTGWCACHDSPTCPDAIAEAFLPRDEYEGWAPGELSEAFGR